MKKLCGSIFECDELIVDRVEIHLETVKEQFPDTRDWFGYFCLPLHGRAESRIIGTEKCSLVLEDGRKGKIAVERVKLDNGERMIFDFVGRGALAA